MWRHGGHSYKIPWDLHGHLDIWGQWQGQWIFFLYRLDCPFITRPILNRVSSDFQLWSLKKGTSGWRDITSWIYLIWNISVILKLWDWYQTYFGKKQYDDDFNFVKKTLFYVTSGLADMVSLNFQLRISLLFFVGLSYTLVRVIWLVHVALKSYKISCELEGHLDLWCQWQGQCIFFLHRLICPFISPPILDHVTSNFQLCSLKKSFRLQRYYVIYIFKLRYLRYLPSDWAQICLRKIRLTMCICILTYVI